jgi:hypothetical protein
MKTSEVRYSRKFNLGNYETEEIGIVVMVEEGEKFGDVLSVARKAVLSQGKQSPAKELQAVLDKKND